ncbi:MAG: hypothetical protein K2X82_01645 [Gemmataceae bacterium]|nr:hypothetical protein [Gemmataceae bacterium]
MTRLLLAAGVIALAAGPASAQFAVRAGVNPWTGRAHSTTVARNPWTGGVQARTNTVNPWTGTRTTHTAGFNPWTGTAYRGGAAVNPWTGRHAAYGYGRRW